MSILSYFLEVPDINESHLYKGRVKRRNRLGEPEPELSSLSQREQRAILREKMGLPPI